MSGYEVTDEMVDRALDAFYPGYTQPGHHSDQRERMRRALTVASLSPIPSNTEDEGGHK
jgi:hypothetical protein